MFFDQEIELLAPHMRVHFPAASGYGSLEEALSDTTHMAIVAHADDDGVLAGQAISETYLNPDKHLTVIVVSASPGTGRPPGYEGFDDAAMVAIRRREQIDASDVGCYAATAQLGFSKNEIMGLENGDFTAAHNIQVTLRDILRHTPRLDSLYLHSIFDEHDTHQALTMLTLDALRELEKAERPQNCYGVEVSSSLSWLPPEHKKRLFISQMRTVKAILGRYKTELAKRKYDEGVEGRSIANAVFQRDMGTSPAEPYLCALDYGSILNAPQNVTTGGAMREMMEKILGDFALQKLRHDRIAAYNQLKSVLG